MIVTTAITAATPTTMPIKVSAVRNLLARRLPIATRNASHNAATRRSLNTFLIGAAICAAPFAEVAPIAAGVSLTGDIRLPEYYGARRYLKCYEPRRFGFAV